MPLPTTHPGILYSVPRHHSHSQGPLVAFSHTPHQAAQKNVLLFLGGLFDGLLTVPYVSTLAARLPAEWRVVEPVLGSSYRQWGFSSLRDDVNEILDLVRYFRQTDEEGEGKVVLMGHSTGCQMIMYYLLNSTPAKGEEEGLSGVRGVLMQGSVSDREAMTTMLPIDEYEEACRVAQKHVDGWRALDVLPSMYTEKAFGSAPVTASRFLSLASPGPEHQGEDDYFSSDFNDERLGATFGKMGGVGLRVAFLYGEKDQYVPENINKQKMISRWQRQIEIGGGVVDEASGILKGASHTLKEGGEAVDELVEKVMGFLSRV